MSTLRYLLSIIVIKKTTNNKCLHYCWNCKLMQPPWKIIWRFLKKLKIELPYGPSIPLMNIYLKKSKTPTWKGTCTPLFIEALFTNNNEKMTKIWQQPKCSSTESLLTYISLHDARRCYSRFIYNSPNLEATKMSFSRWMDTLWYTKTWNTIQC